MSWRDVEPWEVGLGRYIQGQAIYLLSICLVLVTVLGVSRSLGMGVN